jgi:hypothetical protein
MTNNLYKDLDEAQSEAINGGWTIRRSDIYQVNLSFVDVKTAKKKIEVIQTNVIGNNNF